METLLTILAAALLAGGAATGVVLSAADNPGDKPSSSVVAPADSAEPGSLDSSTLSYDKG